MLQKGSLLISVKSLARERSGIGKLQFANCEEDHCPETLKCSKTSRFTLCCLDQTVHSFGERIAGAMNKIGQNFFLVSSQTARCCFHRLQATVHHPTGQAAHYSFCVCLLLAKVEVIQLLHHLEGSASLGIFLAQNHFACLLLLVHPSFRDHQQFLSRLSALGVFLSLLLLTNLVHRFQQWS